MHHWELIYVASILSGVLSGPATYTCQNTLTGEVIMNSADVVPAGTFWQLPGPEVDPNNEYNIFPNMRCTWELTTSSTANNVHIVIGPHNVNPDKDENSEGLNCEGEAELTELTIATTSAGTSDRFYCGRHAPGPYVAEASARSVKIVMTTNATLIPSRVFDAAMLEETTQPGKRRKRTYGSTDSDDDNSDSVENDEIANLLRRYVRTKNDAEFCKSCDWKYRNLVRSCRCQAWGRESKTPKVCLVEKKLKARQKDVQAD